MRSLVFLLLVASASAKIYERCELARVLKSNGMDRVRGTSLGDWICLARFESRYNTQAVNVNTDGSRDFGIFQINSRWWCTDGRTSSRNACNINCSELQTDDIRKAIDCAKRVVQDRAGLGAWVAWRAHCQNHDLSSYVAGCGV